MAQRQRLPAARERRAGLPRRAEGAASGRSRSLSNATDTPGAGERAERREDARALRLRAAVVLADRHEERRRLRLRHRDRARAPRCRRSRACSAMLPAEQLWPIDEFWTFHAGGDEFKDLKLFTAALEARYGKATRRRGLRAQGAGARLRGPARDVRGVRPQQVHVHRRDPVDAEQRLAVDDLAPLRLLPAAGRRLLRHEEGVRAAARAVLVRRPNRRGGERSAGAVQGVEGHRRRSSISALQQKFSRDQTLDLGADSVARTFVVPAPQGTSTTYFLRLSLTDASSSVLSTNFYWLSTKPDVLDEAGTKWYYTPTARHADLTELSKLPATTLAISRRSRMLARTRPRS